MEPLPDLIRAWNDQADEHNQWDTLGNDEIVAFAQQRAIAAERERLLAALTRHDWQSKNIWRYYYPSATGDWVDLRELRKALLGPNAELTGRRPE